MSLMTMFISLCSSPPSGLLDTKKPQVRFTYCSQCPVEWRVAAKVYSGPASGWYPRSCGLLGSSSLLLPFVVRCPSVCLYCARLVTRFFRKHVPNCYYYLNLFKGTPFDATSYPVDAFRRENISEHLRCRSTEHVPWCHSAEEIYSF